MRIDAVCFDMDGTLMRNTDSVRFLCTLNNRVDEWQEIEGREATGAITWIESDYLKAALLKGLDLAVVASEFRNHVRLIENIEPVLGFLRRNGVLSVLITAGAIQVAEVLGAKLDFDGIYGSVYEVKEETFTGKITSHVGNDGKLRCLESFCVRNDINLDNCIAIGDSESDIAVIERCKRSIAVNCSESLKGKATEYVITEDLSDIVSMLTSWLSEAT